MNPLDLTVHEAISMPGGSELLLILLIVLVVFGHNRIPQLGEALGKGIKNFRKSFAKDETPTLPADKTIRQLPEDQQGEVADRLKESDHHRVG